MGVSSPQTRSSVKPPSSAEKVIFWGQPEGQGPNGPALHPLELCLTASNGGGVCFCPSLPVSTGYFQILLLSHKNP